MSTEAAKGNAANNDDGVVNPPPTGDMETEEVQADGDSKMPATPQASTMDENKRPPPGSTSSINSKALGEELGNPTGSDVVLVPVNPRLSAPSIAAPGSLAQNHIDRRKRLFSAKRFFECDANIPIRKKRVAKKSLTPSKRAARRISDQDWDDYFHHDGSQKPPPPTPTPTPTAQAQRTTKAAAAAAPTPNSNNPKPSNSTSRPAKPKTNRPVEMYRGPPDEDMSDVGGWPPGWIKTLVQRKGGSSAGHKDRYWFSPEGRKFRSMKDVRKFLKALTVCNGIEDEAKKVYQKM